MILECTCLGNTEKNPLPCYICIIFLQIMVYCLIVIKKYQCSFETTRQKTVIIIMHPLCNL